MTIPVSPSDHVAPHASMSAAQYAASRHAVWLSAAAIITDQIGRILLVNPTYREDDRWLMPGGAAEPGEHPVHACRREIAEELDLQDRAFPRVLAVHSLSPHHPDIRPGMPCPGEIRYIFDGGTLTPEQIQAIRLPSQELSEYAFLETRDAVQRLLPVDGQIMLAAYRARLGSTGTAHLADGQHTLKIPALDRHDVHVRYRPLWDSPLRLTPVPDQLPVQQAWAWCFVPDGRAVLVADPSPVSAPQSQGRSRAAERGGSDAGKNPVGSGATTGTHVVARARRASRAVSSASPVPRPARNTPSSSSSLSSSAEAETGRSAIRAIATR